MDLPIRLLAAGMALCAEHHVDCYRMDRVQMEMTVIWSDGIIRGGGTPETGDGAIQRATYTCSHDIAKTSHGLEEVPTDKYEPVLVYEYQMYDGDWGTAYICKPKVKAATPCIGDEKECALQY